MAPGYIISFIILGISLVALIVFGVMTAKKIKPTLNNLQETQSVAMDHVEHFTREAESIQNNVEHIVQRVERLQKETELKLENFDELSAYASGLGDSLTYLKDNSGDLSKGIAKNAFNELKTDGPKLVKTFNLAIKRTFQKQKARYDH